MKFQKQTIDHYPSIGKIGDCFRTCLACLLDLEVTEVPHFLSIHYDPTSPNPHLESPEMKTHIKDWLASKGYALVEVPYQAEAEERPNRIMEHLALKDGEDMCYLLSGRSVNAAHVVIGRGPKILWDPSPTNSGIVAPVDGVYWISYLVSIRMRYNGPQPTGE